MFNRFVINLVSFNKDKLSDVAGTSKKKCNLLDKFAVHKTESEGCEVMYISVIRRSITDQSCFEQYPGTIRQTRSTCVHVSLIQFFYLEKCTESVK
jgi:hypothetical protein